VKQAKLSSKKLSIGRSKNISSLFVLHILEYLAEHPKGVSIRMASKDMQSSKSTIFRYFASLVELGYLKQETERGSYFPTPKIVLLGRNIIADLEVRSISSPFIEKLMIETKETVHLSILEGTNIIYVAKASGPQPAQMVSKIGGSAAVHSTASGKVLLAFLPKLELAKVIDKIDFSPKTNNTITDKSTFLNHLQEVRRKGYALDEEENEMGIRCLAAPIHNDRGEVIASISVSGWIVSMTQVKINNLIPKILKVADEISEAMGQHKLSNGNRKED
jgi:IclR family KDG regulon transcriptional repressor